MKKIDSKPDSLSIREDEDFGDFMSKTLLNIGQILAMSGGGSFLILMLSPFFHAPPLPYKLLMIMVPVGVFGGSFLLVLGGMMRNR